MASMVAKASSSQVSSFHSVQEKVSRNKRKFRAEPPLGEADKIIAPPQNECPTYEFSAEKFEPTPVHGLASACDLCGVNQDHADGLKLDLGLSTALGSTEVVEPIQPREELEESNDADWSDLTESQLEELVLSNLDAIFKSAIKRIVTFGYVEEVVTKAVLRSSVCYGCKDTVSNIVDNTLAFLRNCEEIDPSKEHCFDDLQQLEKYILAELVCVLREVRPFFSTGDAMWCLLICDMNVSHACAMDGDPMSGFAGDGSHSKLEPEGSESNVTRTTPCKPVPSIPCSPSTSIPPGVSHVIRPKNNGSVLNGLLSDKEGSATSAFDPVDKCFSIAGPSQLPVLEERFTVSRKVHSGSSKREFILRQKSVHLEKSYRTYGSKGSLRGGKLSGLSNLILDKKLKSVSDSAAVNIKNASIRLSKAMGVVDNSPPDGGKSGPSSSVSFSLETPSTTSSLPKAHILPVLPPANSSPVLPLVSVTYPLSTADTELSLSLPTKAQNYSFSGKPCDNKPMAQWVPRDKKDEMIVKLLPRVRELQNQLQEWTEWANQKVMQAARRLGKDKAELKLLRQEREEVERLKKDKQTLEENTMKKLTEMENALGKASGQVDRANSAVRRLEVENAVLRQEMEVAKLRAAESAASCQEVSKREKRTLVKVQSWEKQKGMLLEELVSEKRKVSQLLQDLDAARQQQDQQEARWKQEEKAKEELLSQASKIRKEREKIESWSKSKEDMIKLKAETNLQKHKEDIQKLEKEISQLRLKADSSKIAALRRGIDGTRAPMDFKTNPAVRKETNRSNHGLPEVVITDFNDYCLDDGGVKRERECVMCLSEEMSVVFLPCAHQVVCTNCNELHVKQGMKDCPSCRSFIKRRVAVRYAPPRS
ncbi:unnamed protein product [Linum trigynum]|uniref:RING-type domain-containing protein n=1 Tax=Linum trigynum TaxID=586398 RepID=A0AAV2FGX4_9ROSI